MAKWSKNVDSADPAPAFIEALPLPAVEAKPRPGPATPLKGKAAICQITLGNTDIEISPGYSGDHLTEILWAVRALQ